MERPPPQTFSLPILEAVLTLFRPHEPSTLPFLEAALAAPRRSQVLSNYSLALAVAKMDQELLHEMAEELTKDGDYLSANQAHTRHLNIPSSSTHTQHMTPFLTLPSQTPPPPRPPGSNLLLPHPTTSTHPRLHTIPVRTSDSRSYGQGEPLT